MRKFLSGLLTLTMVGAIVGGGFGYYLFYSAGPLDEERVVAVPPEAHLSQIATEFERDGVIINAFAFKLAGRILGVEREVKAGEYRIAAGASTIDVLDQVTQGRAVEHRFTVAEGLTSWEIVELLRANTVLTGEIAEVPPEGSLAPNTYFVLRGQTREEILRQMQEDQQGTLAELWEARAENLPLASPEEALVLASIVEKETGVASERGRVASVFVNRLRRDQRLETDPTVIYGVTGGKGPLGRPLRRSELDRETPYNTYKIKGLPPTPIANPGRAAIEATLNPDDTEFLFFVANGTGGHTFSRTYDEHRVAVRRLRALEAERRAAAEEAAKQEAKNQEADEDQESDVQDADLQEAASETD